MVSDKEFRKIIDDDLMKLKYILKSKVASIEEIKKQEQSIVDTIKKLITSIRQVEESLEKEIAKYKRFQKGWEKVHARKKWDVIGSAIKEEIGNFNQEYMKTKDLYDTCSMLNQRLEQLRGMLKKMNARNKESKQKELEILEEFRKQKTGEGDLEAFEL